MNNIEYAFAGEMSAMSLPALLNIAGQSNTCQCPILGTASGELLGAPRAGAALFQACSGASARRCARDKWRFSVNATNLFDKRYFASCLDRGDCFMGAPRNVMGTIGWRF